MGRGKRSLLMEKRRGRHSAWREVRKMEYGTGKGKGRKGKVLEKCGREGRGRNGKGREKATFENG